MVNICRFIYTGFVMELRVTPLLGDSVDLRKAIISRNYVPGMALNIGMGKLSSRILLCLSPGRIFLVTRRRIKGCLWLRNSIPFSLFLCARVLYLKEAWYRFSTRLNSRLSELLAPIKLLPIKTKV